MVSPVQGWYDEQDEILEVSNHLIWPGEGFRSSREEQLIGESEIQREWKEKWRRQIQTNLLRKFAIKGDREIGEYLEWEENKTFTCR